jgi:hypothetical protein
MDREALADGRQRVVVESAVAARVDLRAESPRVGVVEESPQHRAAAVGGAAHQPDIAESMAVDAVARRDCTGSADRILSTSVLPRLVTASPISAAPAAMTAAVLSVVPAQIQVCAAGRPVRAPPGSMRPSDGARRVHPGQGGARQRQRGSQSGQRRACTS